MKNILHRIVMMIFLSVLTAVLAVGQNTYRVNRGSVKEYKIEKPAGKVTYSWQVFNDVDFGSATAASKVDLKMGGTDHENEVKVNWKETGDYYLRVTVTSTSGCINRMAWHFLVDQPANDHPIARINGPAVLTIPACSNEGQVLDASASVGNNLVYHWAPSLYLDDASSSKPKFNPGNTTRYKLTVTDSKGLSDTASILVVVADAPKAVTDKNVFVGTPNASIVLNGTQSTGVGLSYSWTTKEGHIIAGENQSTTTVNGLGTYYLLVKDSFGCTSRDSVNVGLYIQAINDTALVSVNQSVIINVLKNDLPRGAFDPSSVTIVSPPSHGIATLTADSLISYQAQNSYTGQDEFEYTVCDFAGICDNAKVLVLVTDLPFFIPEAFSPNGDGINDQFVIKGLEKYNRTQIEIFNRWGNVVYKSNNYGGGEGKDGYWDGVASSGLRIVSGPVPSGTYYYILKISGQKNISGAVYLDR